MRAWLEHKWQGIPTHYFSPMGHLVNTLWRLCCPRRRSLCACAVLRWIDNATSRSLRTVRFMIVGNKYELALAGSMRCGKEKAINQGTGNTEVGSSRMHSLVNSVLNGH